MTRAEMGRLHCLAVVESSGTVSTRELVSALFAEDLIEGTGIGTYRLTVTGRLELMGLRKWRDDELKDRENMWPVSSQNADGTWSEIAWFETQEEQMAYIRDSGYVRDETTEDEWVK